VSAAGGGDVVVCVFGNVGKGQVPEVRDVARVDSAEGVCAQVAARGSVALARALQQRPQCSLEVACGDGRAAGVLLTPPLLGAGRSDSGPDDNGIQEEGGLVEATWAVDARHGRGVGEHVLICVDDACRILGVGIHGLIVVDTPGFLVATSSA